MKGIGTRTIETERLIMRRMEKGDALLMYKNWTSDPLVSRYVTWDTHTSLEATQAYVDYKVKRYEEKEYVFDWVLVLKETGEPIGEMEACDVSLRDRLVIMGDCIGSKFWNKGYATEALKAFIDYMFDQVGVDKVIAYHLSVNPASGRVMAKAGMHLDAVLKGYLVDKLTGNRVDKVVYSIDKEDR